MNGVIGPGFLNQVPTLKGAFGLKIDAASQIFILSASASSHSFHHDSC